MKNTLLAITIIIAFTVVSCKKADRVCECTGSDGSYSIKYTDKTSKGEAKTVCEGFKVKSSDGSNDFSTVEDGESCKLK